MMKLAYLLAASAAAFSVASASAEQHLTKSYYEFKKPRAITPDLGQVFGVDPKGVSPTVINQGSLQIGFEGISQYDVAAVQRNFIPPDTIGAVGRTQYMQFVNGGVAIFNKASGVRTSFQSDTAFWAALGQPGANGDSRVLYNSQANRWIALSFASDPRNIQIAVSKTGDASGPWQATQFQGYAGLGFGGTADYPTLAMDTNAIYIGTNNFAPAIAGGTNSFRGTTLNVIPLASLFSKNAPTTTGNVQFNTAFNSSVNNNDFTRGFAIQGVNSKEVTTTGNIIAASINDYGLTRYDVLNAGTAAAVRTATASTTIGTTYTDNAPARQPSAAIPANRRIIDSFGDQISSSAFENDGKIYSVHTVTPIGGQFTQVRVTVLDSVTNAVLEELTIGDATHDFYQGSLAVNQLGQVVVAYNRSGLNPADGRVTLAARTFNTSAFGTLVSTGTEVVLRVSDTDDYHNGSLFGQAAAGRQRWADYATVTTDPTSIHAFWISGTFAREYNNAAGGHPGGTGGSRWGTYIASLNVGAVPEPGTWAMMLIGFGFVGAAARRRSKGYATA